MRYEYTIGLRYLLSRRSSREPSLIGALTVAGIALSTGVMIAVLAVMAGMEGDLRDKILGTHAHILVSGEEPGVLKNPDAVVDALFDVPGVVGVSPFVETEIMISSSTNYSALVLRGLDVDEPNPASVIASFMTEGDLAWVNDSAKAVAFRASFMEERGGILNDLDELTVQIEATRREIENIRRNAALGLDSEGNPIDPDLLEREAEKDRVRDDNTPPEDKSEASSGDALMPGLPAPSTGEDALMPGLPAPSTGEDALMPGLPAPSADGDEPAASAPSEVDAPEDLPGIVIGSELQRTLNVLVGDTVNLISPDGDLGPSGLIPRSRPYRVVGVFYTGYYLYDAGMGVVDMDSARSLLDIPADEVTGVEVRTEDLNRASKTAASVRTALLATGHGYDVRDWRELNRSLFAALQLERVAVSAVLTFIIVISGLLVLLVVFMFVIDKRREIAVLKAIGSSRVSIARIFLAQGLVMGLIGTLGGVALGLAFVGYCTWVGVPLPVEQYYIDRLPVVTSASEVAFVALSALVVTVGATMFPAIQASKLDPVTGLRDDQDI